MRTASLALALVFAVIAPPASSQLAPTGQELERLSRQLAVESVKLSVGLRWRPGQFPLRVAFSAGEELKKNSAECSDGWQRRYDEYVQFINAERTVLVATPTTGDLDAFVFFGSDAELDASPAWRLQEAWSWKPGISVQSRWLDRYSSSYHWVLGAGQFVDFSAAFLHLDPDTLNCERVDATMELSSALLSDHVAYITAQAHRLFDGRPPHTLEWRAYRRLLAAMARLPEEDLTSQLVKLALIRELTHD